ncbi:hypothetical protein [Pseudomonas sp. MWU13-2105]|uniref:hypothetical protein n=1 Tax=Pseudomonas sp. MWU13-2105 TaxID=2935074 RepID=UPI00200D1EC3|nr:hypothetical protein [Pseudomonas sp. MWU13-2105]
MAELKGVYPIEAYGGCEDLFVPGAAGRLIEQVNVLGLPIEFLVNNAGAGIVGLAYQDHDATQLTAISLSHDLRRTGVTCTHLAPGPTRTNFFVAAGLVDERRMAKLGYSQPDDIARIGYRAMYAGRTAVMPGLSNNIVTWLARISPSRTLTGNISANVVSRELD